MDTLITRRPMTRRGVIAAGAAAVAGGAFLPRPLAAQQTHDHAGHGAAAPTRYSNDRWDKPGAPGADYTPVVTPNGWTLPYRVVNGVKVFHLVAEEVPDHEFAPGLKARCWGYNGSVHGPTIEAVEGDRVRIYVTNKLPAPTTVHWHGVLLPNGMDGVGGLNQAAIGVGETFVYEFTLRQHGTFMYHSHHDEMTQMALGLMGMLVVHPRGVPREKRPDRDFAIMLSEWFIRPGTDRPDPNVMSDFNVLTMNGRAFPGTQPLVAKLGDRVRIRLGNLGAMDHHPIHLHGFEFRLVAADGGDIPEAVQSPAGTVLVPVGGTRDIEFVADNPGDWAIHCHMTHHVMNQMGHDVPNVIGMDAGGLDAKIRQVLPGYMTMGQDGMGDHGRHLQHMRTPPNSIPMVGAEGPFDYITMGGMFTIVKVREDLKSYEEDPGWYEHPAGTVAIAATEEQLGRDGVSADGGNAPVAPASVRPASRPAPSRKGGNPPQKHGENGHNGHAHH
jgi:FtsP/CotA-like multicopper oxidase with cupredoxin domain